jgi:hypothetical protein
VLSLAHTLVFSFAPSGVTSAGLNVNTSAERSAGFGVAYGGCQRLFGPNAPEDGGCEQGEVERPKEEPVSTMSRSARRGTAEVISREGDRYEP